LTMHRTSTSPGFNNCTLCRRNWPWSSILFLSVHSHVLQYDLIAIIIIIGVGYG